MRGFCETFYESKLFSPNTGVIRTAVPPTGSGITLIGVVSGFIVEISQRHTSMCVP
jgi:hypothetical protein